MRLIAAIFFLSFLVACAFNSTPPTSQLAPLKTVVQVDLSRYLGLWFEIGRYANSFQKGCLESTATYSIRPDGDIDVLNSCHNEEDGRLREAHGRAWVVDSSNARLKVSFFWPFRGDYWIIDLGKDYEYAVVGTPDRKYLWILSRTPQMHPDLLAGVMQGIEEQGFIRDHLLFTERR